MSRFTNSALGATTFAASSPVFAQAQPFDHISWQAVATSVPVGGPMTLLLGMALLATAYWFMQRKNQKFMQHLSIAALVVGTLSLSYGGKLINDTYALNGGSDIDITEPKGTALICDYFVYVNNRLSRDVKITELVANGNMDPDGCDVAVATGEQSAPQGVMVEGEPCYQGMTLAAGDTCSISIVE